MLFEWNDPTDNGAPIIGYKIYIIESDGVTFTQESIECDGTSQTLIDNRNCLVDLTTLRAAPYNLVLEDSVQIKVISINSYGDSEYSLTGNGAEIQYVPDAPILSNDAAVTSATNIGLTWVEGASDGSTEVIDYKLYFKHINDADFIVLETALTSTSYVTSLIL